LIIPKTVWSSLKRIHEFIKQLSTRGIFEKIYEKNAWGGRLGEIYSGNGSHDYYIIQPYIEMVIKYLKSYGQNKPTIVDLGCGDFNVGKRFVNYCSEYICVDVVPEVIRKLKSIGYPPHVRFLCFDIINKELPNGDICFLRQVLQHLSNKQILKILPKLKKYKVIFITEHYPTDSSKAVPNMDIAQGSVRLLINSGVFLDCPPFNVPSKALQLMLEVLDMKGGGVIRTYKVEF